MLIRYRMAYCRTILIRLYDMLGTRSVWKTIPLLLLLSYVIEVPLILLYVYFGIEIGDGPDMQLTPGNILFFCIIVPFLETYLFQYLPIWLLKKIFKKMVIPVYGSAIVFGCLHTYSFAYVVYAFLMGLVFALGFSAYCRKKSYKTAYMSIFLVHSIRNLIAFISVYLGSTL